MKATINAKGVLSIRPENELESYALEKWWGEYDLDGDKGSPSILEVIFIDDQDGVTGGGSTKD